MRHGTLKSLVVALVLLLPAANSALAQTSGGLNAAALIAHYESSGCVNNQNATSSASGCYGFTNATWRTYASEAGVDLTKCPTAASCDIATQTAVFYEDFNQNGFRDWTCSGCDPAAAAAIQADGGDSAFAKGSTNPADYASLDTAAGQQQFFGSYAANGTGVYTQVSGVPQGNIIDSILQAFENATGGWNFTLFATGIFGALAVIDIFFAYWLEVAGREGLPDLGQLIWIFIRWAVPVGTFLTVLQYGPQIAQAIVNTPRAAATAAGATAITPSGVFAAGINIAGSVWQQLQSTWNPVWLAALWLSDIIIELGFIFAAIWMAAALIESYFIVGASTLYLAFGGLRWTRSIAINLLFSCLAIGFKLFAIAIIVLVGQTFLNQWTQVAGSLSARDLLVIIGASIFLGAASKIIPDKLERIVLAAQASMAHHSHVTSAATAGAAAAAAPFVAATGALVAAVEAVRLAATETANKGGEEGRSGGGSTLQTIGAAAGHLAAAQARDLGRRFGGAARGGSSTVRTAQDLGTRRRMAQAAQSRPGNREEIDK